MWKKIKKIINTSIIRFLVVGGCSTIIDFFFYMLMSIKMHVVLAKAFSMLISSVFSYFLNKSWTFKNRGKTNVWYLFKFYLAFAINVGTNIGVNYLVFSRTGYKVTAFVVATGCAMIVNYLLQRFFVFGREI